MITTWQRIYTRYLKVKGGLFDVSLVPMIVMVMRTKPKSAIVTRFPLTSMMMVMVIMIAVMVMSTKAQRAIVTRFLFTISSLSSMFLFAIVQIFHCELSWGKLPLAEKELLINWHKVEVGKYLKCVPFGDLSIEETGNIVKLKVQLEISPT